MKNLKHITSLFLLLIICITLAKGQEHSLDAHTLLLLHFNGNETGAGGESPITANNLTYQPGIFGQGIYFGTNNLLEFASAGNIDEHLGTIEFWVKPSWNPNDNLNHQFLKYGTSGGMIFGKDGGNWWTNNFNYWGGDGINPHIGVSSYVGDSWTPNTWHHVAVTWEATVLKFYIDGSLVAQTPLTFILPFISDNFFQLGGWGNGSYAESVVDELRISNISRSAAEISASYTAGLPISAIDITPDDTNLYPTWVKQTFVTASTPEGPTEIPTTSLSWSSSNPGVATVNAEGYVTAVSAGTATITGTYGGLTDEINVTVINPVLPPQYETIDPFLATPASGAIKEIPVIILRFLPTDDGVNLDVSICPDYWSLGPITLPDLKARIDAFDKRVKFGLEEGSKFRGYNNPAAIPFIGYRVVEYITIYEPPPPWRIKDYDSNGYPVFLIDYHSVFNRFNIEDYINNQGVKEVWVWQSSFDSGTPSYDPMIHNPEDIRFEWESNMSSPTTGDVSNSNRDNTDLPLYNHTYTVYGQNFRRSQAEAVHNRGHQYEAILSHANYLQDSNSDLFWKKFVGQNASGDFITGRCGWTHMPPNTTNNYDYLNTAVVNSDIEDWIPDGSGQSTPVSVSTWENLNYSWPGDASFGQKTESQWYLYWMQSIPGLNNQIPYGTNTITNWWEFVADWDQSINNGLGLYGFFLPLELLKFEAVKRDNTVILEWATANEINNKGFEVQRSSNGSNWEILDFIPGHNNASQEHLYSFNDKSPHPGFNYYRLRQIDQNGQFKYSKVRSLEFKDSNSIADIHIYPNPVSDNLLTIQLSHAGDAEYQISIVDVAGKNWLKQQSTLTKTILDIKEIPTGVYILHLEMEGQILSRKIVIGNE